VNGVLTVAVLLEQAVEVLNKLVLVTLPRRNSELTWEGLRGYRRWQGLRHETGKRAEYDSEQLQLASRFSLLILDIMTAILSQI